MIRRNMLMAEGDLLDEKLVRKSMARLNETGFFEPIAERDVHIQTDEPSGIADIVFQLHERKGGAWSLSGPVGPPASPDRLKLQYGRDCPPGERACWSCPLIALPSACTPSACAGSRSVVSAEGNISAGPGAPEAIHPGDGWRSGLFIAPQLGLRALGGIY